MERDFAPDPIKIEKNLERLESSAKGSSKSILF